MVQRRCRSRFLLEAPQPVRIGTEKSRQYFDRYIPIQPAVMRAIHLAHAARADQRLHFVVAQASAFCQRHPHSGGLQKAGACFVRGSQKRFHVLAEGLIRRADVVEKGRPLLRSEFQRPMQDFFNLLPALGGHS